MATLKELQEKDPGYVYQNADRECNCYICELSTSCPYKDKYQRLPRDKAPGALGLCKKL